MTEAVVDSASAKPRDTSFFGHPKGLAILFFTEMWERFSYYGMRGLLILYLTQHFLFSDEKSAVMYGAYTALVYVMTIIGGTLADRYLGQRKAVTFGAIPLLELLDHPRRRRDRARASGDARHPRRGRVVRRQRGAARRER